MAEDNAVMRGSYAMVDPAGRFYTNSLALLGSGYANKPQVIKSPGRMLLFDDGITLQDLANSRNADSRKDKCCIQQDGYSLFCNQNSLLRKE